MIQVQGLWVGVMVMSQGQGYGLVLGLRVYKLGLGVMCWGYELGLGLWASNHNDYFYVVHQTRIINKVLKKN